MIAASTPWGSTGAFAELFAQAASGELDDAVAHHATTAEANPPIDPGFLAAEERRDPESFCSETWPSSSAPAGSSSTPTTCRPR